MDDLRNDDLIDKTGATEETMSEETTEMPAPSDVDTGFRERLDDADDFYDDDFTRSINPDENPHISDQLEDDDLSREAEADL